MSATPTGVQITKEIIRVRYGETDQMGHAYYGNYALWFEQARGAWCRARGFTYKELEAQGVLLPCVELNVRYRAEIKYDDLIEVDIWVSEVRRASLRFDYVIRRSESDQIATEGFTWHVTMSGQTRRAISIPEFLLGKIQSEPVPGS